MAVFAHAWAGDAPTTLDAPGAPALLLPPTETGKPLLPPTETGKPLLPPGPPLTGQSGSDNCVAPLPCGSRLIGNVRKNGAVEFQVPALKW